jgi:hypothetical protein
MHKGGRNRSEGWFSRLAQLAFLRGSLACLLLFFWVLPAYSETIQPVYVVKVLVVYTPQAIKGAGGTSAMLRQINTAVFEANDVFQNSHANIRVHLALAAEIKYKESGSVCNDLAMLCHPGNGILAQAHSLRDSVGADLVCMITETGNDWSFYGLQGPSAENAFSIIRQPYLTGNYYFPVVLSFNFGCQLERPFAEGVSAFPYAYGCSFWGSDGKFYSTVEAFSGQRIPYFSNPNILFQGTPIGIPAGMANAANDALVLNQTASLVAAFRNPVTLTAPPLVSIASPSQAAIYPVGTNITLSADATDPDGKVIRVDYYEGTNWLGSAETAPFAVSWPKAGLGQYAIMAVATDNDGATTISSPVQITVAPANDDFASRARLAGASDVVHANNTFATAEPGEPSHAGFPPAHSLWWSYTSPANGVLLLDASASSFQASLDVYTGIALNSLTEVTSTATSGKSAVRFQVAAGQTHQICVDGPGGQAGNIDFALNFYPFPANDNFTNRQQLRGNQIKLMADNRGATREVGEPNHSGTLGSASLWWTWTAAANGAFMLSATNDAGANMLVGVYTGDTLTNLNPVPVQFQNPSTYFVPVAQGTSYQIAADSPIDPLAPGPFEFSLSFTPEPSNDHFANRSPIYGTWISLTNPIALATVEPGTPVPNSGWLPSLWWSWTAPVSGYVTIGCASGQFINVFTGTVLTNLTPFASGPGVTFQTTAGATYAIAATGLGSTVGLNLVLSTIQVLAPTNGAIFIGGNKVELVATTTANDGVLTQMQFFANSTLVGTAKHPPYHAAWTNVPDGEFALTAVGSAVSGHKRSSPPVNITIQTPPPIVPPPSNDNFADRTPIQGTELTLTNTDVGATHEPGEPQISLTEYDNSIWWSWKAPASGQVSISTTTPFTTFAVYTGSSLTNLTLVTAGYQGVNFNASEGVAYDITAVGFPGDVALQLILSNLRIVNPTNGELFVTGTNITIQAQPTATEQPVQKIEYFQDGSPLGSVSAPPYTFTWTNIPGGASSLTAVATDSAGNARTSPAVTIQASPPNDDFTNAIILSGEQIQLAGSTLGATIESGEPRQPGTENSGSTVWYAWTAPTSGFYTVVVDADFNWAYQLEVYTGSELTNLTLVGNPNKYGSATFQTSAGTTYYLQVDNSGDFTLDLGPIPANDNFANAFVLTGANINTNGNNSMATLEPGEPHHTGQAHGGHSVWYAWTAPSGGFLTVNATGTNFTPVVDVYTGTNVADLSPVGTNSPSGVSFVTSSDMTYMISVDGSGGLFNLTFSFIPPPSNDDFESRIALIGLNPTVQGTTYLATFQPGEPGFYPWIVGGSVWYSWIAPANGTVRVDCPTAPVAVYTGSSVSNLVVVAPVNPASFADLVFTATAGTEYEFAVAGASWLPDEFTLSLLMPRAQIACPTNGSAFPLPASFEIVARTIDIGGAVASVSFFDGTNLLGTVNHAPFQMDYLNVTPGSHLLSLQSMDVNGFTTTSEPVEVRVEPVNDNFAQRIVLSATTTNWVADNSGATTELGEVLPGGASGRTLWWSWTAPTNGTVLIGSTGFSAAATTATPTAIPAVAATKGVSPNDIIITGPGWGPPGPTTGPLLAVYLNNCISNLSLCASNSGWFPTFEEINPTNGIITYNGEWYVLPSLNFPVTQGQTYQISLDGVNGSFGSTSIAFSFSPAPVPPANDNFAAAAIISGSTLTITGTTVGATSQLGDPSSGVDPTDVTVWYSWTAAASGNVQVSVSANNSSGLNLGIYAGSSLWTLIPVAAGTGQISFYALAGTTYKIMVAGPSGSATEFSLALNGPAPPPSLSVTRQPNGTYQIQVTGVVGQSFSIQASSDSVHWVTIRTDTLQGSYLDFVDTTDEGHPAQFYRLLLLDNVFNDLPFELFAPGSQPGVFSFNLTGSAGQPFRIQTSTNLLDWSDLTSGVLADQPFNYTDLDAAQFQSRFYRAYKQ